jgi:predicted DNA-binding transcriptional regulator AlpA
MSSADPKFPKPLRMNGRLYWRRSELEAYKQNIIRSALGEAAPSRENCHDEVELFVTAEQVTKEFGFGRRTLGRRIAEYSKVESAA